MYGLAVETRFSELMTLTMMLRASHRQVLGRVTHPTTGLPIGSVVAQRDVAIAVMLRTQMLQPLGIEVVHRPCHEGEPQFPHRPASARIRIQKQDNF